MPMKVRDWASSLGLRLFISRTIQISQFFTSAMSRRRVDNLHAMRLRAAFAEFGDPPAIDDWDVGDEDEQFEEFDDEAIY
ncbi:hypothetical protein NBRC116589_41910 [Ruegeria sp. HU-ET01832]|uniref:hypothetical protein n=1 Tax=Ruegeria sp. HU-ET01832 TaxID=3135906 RepID=UPI00310564D2